MTPTETPDRTREHRLLIAIQRDVDEAYAAARYRTGLDAERIIRASLGRTRRTIAGRLGELEVGNVE